MSRLVAVTGKGGTGKSTISASIVRLAVEQGIKPVLAVDADPNSTLGPLLGVSTGDTISDIREQLMEEKARVSGVPKERILGIRLEESIVEAEGFDLLVMGRPEGKSCYCYVNNLLRHALGRMRSNYQLTVVDNEAGMEHLSRMNTDDIDCLVVVSEPTPVSARSAGRILDLAGELNVRVNRRVLVWNKVGKSGVAGKAREIISSGGFNAEITLPLSTEIADISAAEEPLSTAALPEEFKGLLQACSLTEPAAQSG